MRNPIKSSHYSLEKYFSSLEHQLFDAVVNEYYMTESGRSNHSELRHLKKEDKDWTMD